MIEWKKFDPKTAGDEIEEDPHLIFVNGWAVMATHDAMGGYFSRPTDDGEIVYSYSSITHYAEINYPGEEQSE